MNDHLSQMMIALRIVRATDSAETNSANADREAGLVRLLIDIRSEARDNRDWSTSDRIRDQLAELGITLKDGKDGTTFTVG